MAEPVRKAVEHETKLMVVDRAQPSWEALYTIAESQQGCFSSDQATEAGFSSQLLTKHIHNKNTERLHRGMHAHFSTPSYQARWEHGTRRCGCGGDALLVCACPNGGSSNRLSAPGIWPDGASW